MKVKRVRTSTTSGWVVGIDASLTGFGIAAWHPEHLLAVTERYTSRCRGVERLADIVNWLTVWLQRFDVAMVAMEGYSYASRNSQSHSLGELGGAVKLVLFSELPHPVCYPTIVPPPSLKKYATGKGNVKKEQLMMAVYKKWGFEAPNSDEADAYALARLAACMVGTDRSRHAYEADVVAGLTPWTEAPPQPPLKPPSR